MSAAAAAALLVSLLQAPSPAPPAAPALDSGPHAWRDRTYDLVHLDFDLAFDFDAKTVRGAATSRLMPLVDGLKELAFDAEDLAVSSASVNGKPVAA
ncbi:MAG TPA: hypothetical protein VKE69_03565, partial [Planctomycetota bacterium]|nr:hypothetical protein [Planctomycetota bacterium]